MRKTLSCMLCLVLLLMTAVPAFAAGTGGPRLVRLRDTDSANAAIPLPEDYTASVDWDGVFAAVKTALLAHEDSVNVYAFRIPYSGAGDPNYQYFKYYFAYEPSLLKLCSSPRTFETMTENGRTYLYRIPLTDYYNYTAEEYDAMLAACESAKTQLLYGIRDNDALTDAEKCLLLHDRLAAWCEYDSVNVHNDTVPNESYSAYGPLVLRIGVCEGYALAYGWMLDELGIENMFVSSDALHHGWNLVRIDGKAYFTDVTKDDKTYDLLGNVFHDRLLVSDGAYSAMSNNVADFTSHEPQSTDYEDAFWTSVPKMPEVNDPSAGGSEIQYINGCFYYLDNSAYADLSGSAQNKADLVRLDANGSATLKTLSASWHVGTASYIYLGSQAKLTAIGTTLYYSAPKAVYAYDTVSDTEELFYSLPEESFAEGSQIFGLTQKDGVLRLQISPETDYTDSYRGVFVEIPACAHTNKVTLETVTPATCAQGGEIAYICADCRALGTTATAPDPGLHVYGDWVTVTAATCTAAGSERRDCTGCDAFETRETALDPTNHVNTEERAAVAATCANTGREAGVYCLDCQTFVSGGAEIPADAGAHDFGAWTAYIVASCTEKGEERRYCSRCDAYETRETAIDPTAHKHTEERAETPATCAAEGTQAGVFCSDCGQFLSGGGVIPVDPTAHTFGEWTPVSAATCAVKGTERRDCANCDAFETRETDPDPTAHIFGEWTPASAATCTVKGTERRDCANCDAFETRETALDPTNHVNTEEGAAVAATCTAAGREAGVYCSDCGQCLSGGAATGKLPHDYTATVTKPTCTKSGYTTYVCQNCSDTYTGDKTAALGHADADGDRHCDRCGADLSPEANCSCGCHKNGIAGFFFKIKLFFWKLFNLTQHRYCDCGKAHW